LIDLLEWYRAGPKELIDTSALVKLLKLALDNSQQLNLKKIESRTFVGCLAMSAGQRSRAEKEEMSFISRISGNPKLDQRIFSL